MSTIRQCWSFLLLAIVLEICGTGLLKFYVLQEKLIGYVYMFICIGPSYYLLSLAVRRIPISTAYAFWEGVGLLGTTGIAYYIFQEAMPPQKVLAVAIIILSLVLIHKGTYLLEEDHYDT